MSCIQVTACQSTCLPATNFRSIHHSSGTFYMLRVAPTSTDRFPKISLKLASIKSTYPRRAPVCLFGDKEKSGNSNDDKESQWKALEKAMGGSKKEPSFEDLAEQEYTYDGGSTGGIRPGGGGGGDDDGDGGGGVGGQSGGDEGFAGLLDEFLQVFFATIGLVTVYVLIVEGEDATRLVKDMIVFLFRRKKSFRLMRFMDGCSSFFQSLKYEEETLETLDEYLPSWHRSKKLKPSHGGRYDSFLFGAHNPVVEDSDSGEDSDPEEYAASNRKEEYVLEENEEVEEKEEEDRKVPSASYSNPEEEEDREDPPTSYGRPEEEGDDKDPPKSYDSPDEYLEDSDDNSSSDYSDY